MLNLTLARPAAFIGVLFVSACSFVQLSEAGNQVAQAATPDIANCTDVGEVQAQTQSKVVVRRSQGKVQEELIVLARNQAALLGANAIVPVAEPVHGMQKFRAYNCD